MIRPASPADRERLLAMTRACEALTEEEVGWARELIFAEVPIIPGREYSIDVLDTEGRAAGYVCYGPAAEPEAFDLYWIVIAPELQGRGYGSQLLRHVEAETRRNGGRRLLIETSEANAPARSFYARNGYTQVSQLKDFRRILPSRVLLARDLPA